MIRQSKRARPRADLLVLLEDPGAANFVAPLVGPLQASGVDVKVTAAGLARAVLQERGVDFEPVADMSTEDLWRRFKPRLIVVGSAGNHNPLTAGLVLSARRRGVPAVGMVDARMNARERWRGGSGDPLRYAPQWLLVPDEWTARAFQELGFSSGRIFVVGHPHYDYVRSVARRLSAQGREALAARFFPGLEAGQRILTFVTEGSSRVRAYEDQPAGAYRWPGLPRQFGRVEAAVAALLIGVKKLALRPYLVLCLHAKDNVADFSPDARRFDFIRTDEPWLELLYASDLVVGLTSMALAEAVLLGRPVVSILPRAEEQAWLPSVVAECAQCVSSQAELDKEFALFATGKLPARAPSLGHLGASERVLAWLTSVRA